jgi:hypothetical protein
VALLLKRRFDERVELLRSILERGSRIHERQVEALITIHASLEGASFYLGRLASAVRFKSEDDGRLIEKAAGEARVCLENVLPQ